MTAAAEAGARARQEPRRAGEPELLGRAVHHGPADEGRVPQQGAVPGAYSKLHSDS